MLSVTDNARRHLHHYLTAAAKPAPTGKCFRIVPTSHDLFLTLRLADPKPDDTKYQYRGKTVLALPQSLQRVCRERRLHLDDDGKLSLS